MKKSFFIGRTKELGQLENFTLRPTAAVHNPRIAHIWGTSGVGKTSLIERHIANLSNDSIPIICFTPDSESLAAADDVEFYETIFRTASTNLGDLQPWIDRLKTLRYRHDNELKMSIDYYWSQQLSQTIDSVNQDSYLELNDLSLIFVIENPSELSTDLRISFFNFINRICETLSEPSFLSVITTGEADLKTIPEISDFWKKSIAEATSIRLPNLTREETFQLLEAHDLDSNLISKIFNQTQGNPREIIGALGDQNLQTVNFEESYNRGKNMMYQFNHLQRRWVQWAAIMKVCNEETVSMVASGVEIHEFMNWIRNGYPALFEKDDAGYTLHPEIRRAMNAYVKREDPQLFDKINSIFQLFSGVQHSIPNSQHRLLLSRLAHLNYFDLPLLKKAFDESTHMALIELLENKPIFFRKELDSYRLASNIRAAITTYNNLRKNPDEKKLISRVKTLWEEKQKQIAKELSKTEKELHEAEERNRSLTQSLDKIQQEIEKLIKSRHHRTQHTAVRIIPKPKRISMLGAILFQGSGIVILYVDTLVMKNMSLSLIFLSLICIIAGIILGVKPPEQRAVASGPSIQSQKDHSQLNTIIQHLETDLVNLSNEKQNAQRKIEKDKLTILNLQTAQNHNYLNSA